MVGVVGYICNKATSSDGPLASMIAELRRFPFHLTDEYRCELAHVARVHLGVYKPAKQPVFSRDGRFGALAEGMVYSSLRGARASPASGGSGEEESWLDSFLDAFGEVGTRALRDLNGSFALVILDREGGRVHIASDRFGTRPLYYWAKGNDFVFASEAKAILKYPSYQKRLNLVALGKFLRYGRLGMWGGDTWFEGVRVLPPGSVLTVGGGEPELTQYWDVDYSSPSSENADVLGEKLVNSFQRAVALRTSDATLRYSVALSGGLDSRAVMAACAGKANVSAYTFGIKGSRELEIAKRVARAAGAPHFVCAFDPDDAAQYAEEVIELADGNEVVGLSFLLLADKQFRDSVDVSLDGFALDLTLGGSFLRKNVMEAESVPELAGLLDRKFTLFSQSELKRLLCPEFLGNAGRPAEVAFLDLVSQSKGPTIADKADYFALKTRVRNFTIMGHVLTRNYFEDTIPTFDNEFMELVTSIPVGLRFEYRVYRKFFRVLSRELSGIPYERTGLSPNYPQIVWMLGIIFNKAVSTFDKALCRATRGRVVRPDVHGYVDHASALRTSRPWKELMSHTLASQDSLMYRHGIVRRDFVLGLVDDHISGRRDNREKIHYLITFELMLRRFFPDGLGLVGPV